MLSEQPVIPFGVVDGVSHLPQSVFFGPSDNSLGSQDRPRLTRGVVAVFPAFHVEAGTVDAGTAYVDPFRFLLSIVPM